MALSLVVGLLVLPTGDADAHATLARRAIADARDEATTAVREMVFHAERATADADAAHARAVEAVRDMVRHAESRVAQVENVAHTVAADVETARAQGIEAVTELTAYVADRFLRYLQMNFQHDYNAAVNIQRRCESLIADKSVVHNIL